jgi:hypothetical protein
MTFRDLFKKSKIRRLPSRPLVSDWTTGWTTRDWADLPVHHPRHDSGSTR